MKALGASLLICALAGSRVEAQITIVDSTVFSGQYTSVMIGSDGLPLISHGEIVNPSKLRVAHCNDVACVTPATITILDPDFGGYYTSIALGTDGLGLIGYARSNTHLKVAHCDNIACTTASSTPLDAGSFSTIDLAIGGDGLGLISYFDNVNNDVKVAHCNNTICSSATIATLDPTPAGGWYTSIAIGTDGLGLIAYASGNLGGPGGDVVLKVAHCDNASCTTSTISPVDTGLGQLGEYVGLYPAVVIGVDGFGLISYHRQKNGEPQQQRAAHCLNLSCTSSAINTFEYANNGYRAVALGADGFPLNSYASMGGLRLARCSDQTCTAATFNSIDTTSVGNYNDLAIGTDDLPIISYMGGGGVSELQLKVAHCLDRFCGAPPPALGYYTLAPCRLVDTRNPPGALGGPALVAMADREFQLTGICGIPPTAKALSVNLAATGSSAPGNLRLHPAGTLVPLISSINYSVGQTRGNNAIAPLSAGGALTVYCAQVSGTVDFILDVNGYFQ